MKGKEALEWLARNVHKWQEGKNFICYSMDHGCHIFHEHNKNCAEWFTHQEWLSMREKLQNKPSWKDAPEWANWLGQNYIGLWTFISDEPSAHTAGGWTTLYQSERLCVNHDKPGEIIGDWRDTLEKRPYMTSKNNDVRECEDVPEIGFSAGGKIDYRWQEWQNNHEAEELIITIKNNTITSVATATKTGPSEMTITTQDNSWHERGERPPLNVVVEWDEWGNGNWVETKLLADTGDDEFVMIVKGVKTIVGRPANFRPLRTEREKAIDEMVSVTLAVINQDTQRQMFGMLYDAGYRKQ